MPGDAPRDRTPALEIRDLRFRWTPDAAWTLELPRLVLAPGEQVLVGGPSGGGKSTLLHLIAGLVEPDAGRILVDGTDVAALAPAARDAFRGRRIGMVFQVLHLLHGFTALENVMMALVVSDLPRAEHADRARAILAELGIERTDAFPEQLSVGQRQRVAVARAIVAGPALVLADEPTASLDPDTAAAAMDLIQQAAARHGAALLCTSHDPAMVPRFGRVLRMAADGRLEPSGSDRAAPRGPAAPPTTTVAPAELARGDR